MFGEGQDEVEQSGYTSNPKVGGGVLGVMKEAYQHLPGWNEFRKRRIFVLYFSKGEMIFKGCVPTP